MEDKENKKWVLVYEKEFQLPYAWKTFQGLFVKGQFLNPKTDFHVHFWFKT